uniref:Choline/ethanolamine phosphotransferase 1 n=1 Tax=Myotis myotis TaxID=51298 RepID=A0A7J7SPM1_MYOMY|nr:choline/ethanolamine phosphotransferase 1 [Myotis myotis]
MWGRARGVPRGLRAHERPRVCVKQVVSAAHAAAVQAPAQAAGRAQIPECRPVPAGAPDAGVLGVARGKGPLLDRPEPHHHRRAVHKHLHDGLISLLLPYSHRAVFVVLGTCIAVQLGTNPDWMFFCCFAGTFMFYCAHWQTYVSGTLRFGIFDVTESQIIIIICQLLTGTLGPWFWNSTIPVLNIQVKIFPALCTVAGTIFSCTNYFRVIFTGGVGKNGSTIAGTSVLSPFLHIGSVITLAVMIYKKSAVQLFEKHPCLYILTFGFVSAKITNKLVVAHMTKSEMHLHDTAFIGPALLFLDQYFNSFIDEYIVLWIALVFSLFDLIRYCVSVCNQIASHLHIHVFRIKVSTAHSNHH